MKTITCKQMGGPCDAKFQGNTPDEIMDKGAKHVHEMAANKDEGHVKAEEMMKSAGSNPEEMKKWQEHFTQTYNMAPEE